MSGWVYDTLGVPWACSLLGFLSLLMAVIPFVFVWKGNSIRGRSQFCQYLLQREIEEAEKKARRERREQRRLERERARLEASAGASGSLKDDSIV
ncbi:uncharacterized protein PV09_03984 [Verruconis gallopava]|uniref:Uncharacterized protein n=1 Tax=Verruconis gallopava TaxID=253628 RepID=A0A0D2ACZ6_9PEZI|nr:uncharacterized protein PV09_03984 [Verruconis gallopava]KIW04798.1 hypothetical protein PV09_03984 [Verruconis gallopava]